jgi:sigma-B regulation protein RsbU (phosphoserine phosphatase)
MEQQISSKDRQKFYLSTLLDITLSINANLPTEDLLSKYESLLRNSLGIGKILIFKHGDRWTCILNAGFPKHLEKSIDVESRLFGFREITKLTQDHGFEGADMIIPVYNNLVPLAFIFLGDIDEEGPLMSPVLKHQNFIQTFSSIIIVAIENIRLFNESLRQEAMKKELELAARMQTALIPRENQLPDKGRIIVNGFYYPHSEVGGDYYDCIKLSDNIFGFCIADVSGKGISAAMLMSNFQASFRALFTFDIPLEILVRKLNSIVVANAGGEKFITFFVSRYNQQSGILEYLNAAHNPPVFYNTVTGYTKLFNPSCVGIGMLDEIPVIHKQEIKVKNYSVIPTVFQNLKEMMVKTLVPEKLSDTSQIPAR